MTGTVRFFDVRKGFGFIAPDNGGSDVYLHRGAVEYAGLETITEGVRVTFTTVRDGKGTGLKAQNLAILPIK
jgi:CspA family cold shock protein